MSFFSAIRVALAALLVNKGRSTLTSLGIVIGISAVIAMVAAGNGARQVLDERLASIGKNMILIRAGGRTPHGTIADFKPLTDADAEALRKQLGTLLTGVSESEATQRMASSRTGNWATTVFGATPYLQQIREWKVAQGRFLTREDMDKQAAVAVIGKITRDKLFGATAHAVGGLIRILAGCRCASSASWRPRAACRPGPTRTTRSCCPLPRSSASWSARNMSS
jgi:putative ABC transport system permease protein